MFLPLFGGDEELPRDKRVYDNVVGSRFLLRMSNELRSVSRRLTVRFTKSSGTYGSERNPASTMSSRAAVQVQASEGASSRSPIPSSIVQVPVPVPGSDLMKTGEPPTHKRSHRSFAFRLFCLIGVFLVVVGLIVAIAVAPIARSSASNEATGTTTFAPSSSPSVAATVPFSTAAPTPLLTSEAPSAAPTVSPTQKKGGPPGNSPGNSPN